jgi:N-acetylmuramoyl-L-alanine amidase
VFLKVFFLGILFFSSALFLKAQPDAFTVVMPNERKVSLSIFTVNNRDYFSFKEIGQRLFPGSILISQGTEISFKNTLLRTAPSGFFVIYETPDDGITAQMNLPALKLGRELYVPAPGFLEVFETLGIYSIALSSPQLIVFKKFEKPVVYTEEAFKSAAEEIPEEEETVHVTAGPMTRSGRTILQQTVDEFKPKLSPVLKNLKSGWPTAENSPNAPQQESPFKSQAPKADTASLPQGITPNHYMLPRDLRRRALERTKDGSFKSDEILLKNRPLYASASLMVEPDRTSITKIEVNDKKLSTEIIFTAGSAIADFHKPEVLKKDVIFRIPNSLLLFKNSDRLFKDHPLVKTFKATQIRGFCVFTVELHNEISKATARRVGVNKIVLELFKNDAIAENEDNDVLKEKKEKSAKDRWKLDVIVLDPGHGGEDHGATSINGFKEKDITLEIAKKVEQLLKKKLPDTKVVMTRRDDTFIELYRRGQIANESKGKLFISIHCNSMPKKPHKANGFETYILRPGRNDDAIRVADRENAAVKFEDEQKRYKKLTDEQLIIATMAQSAFVKFSEHFAELLQHEVSKMTPLHSRGVSQAGFFVLVGASMPNVLFETAFLSNENDEEYLTSEKGKQKMAEGIAKAVERYAAEYEELLKGK